MIPRNFNRVNIVFEKYWYLILDIRHWFWYWRLDIDIETFANDILGGRKGRSRTLCQGATAWPGTSGRCMECCMILILYFGMSWLLCSWFVTLSNTMSQNLIHYICMSVHLGIVFIRLGTGARPSHTLQWDHQLANGWGDLKFGNEMHLARTCEIYEIKF